jgi:hypothetical protein
MFDNFSTQSNFETHNEFNPYLNSSFSFNQENPLTPGFQTFPQQSQHDQVMQMLNEIRTRLGGFNHEESLSAGLNRISSSRSGLIQNVDPTQLNQLSSQIQELHNTTAQLVGQANDNSRMIFTLREAITNANTLLNQTSNTHRNDIDQLIKENLLLRENLENLVGALKNSTLRK